MDAPRSPEPHLRLHAPPDPARFVATATTPRRRPALSLPIVRQMALHALAERGGNAPDDLFYELLLAHDRLVAAWVAHHGITPALPHGAVIRVVSNDRDWNRVEVEGEIVGIDLVHGKYKVFSPALGHVRSGPGPLSRAIPFEDVRLAADVDALCDAA
ncbi:hypothetical protein [Azospirillum sp. sgz301742]